MPRPKKSTTTASTKTKKEAESSTPQKISQKSQPESVPSPSSSPTKTTKTTTEPSSSEPLHLKALNLAFSTTEDCFHFFCHHYLRPTSCSIDRDSNDESLGSGSITIENFSSTHSQSPSEFISSLNSKSLRLDSKYILFILDPKSESGPQLSVDFIPSTIKISDIYNSLSLKGLVTNVRTSIGARKASVSFDKNDEIYKTNLIEVKIGDKNYKVSKLEKAKFPNSQKVFIYDFDEKLTENQLKNYFKNFGTIVDFLLLSKRRESDGSLYRYGFVTYEDEEVASQLIDMGSHEIAGFNVMSKKAVDKLRGGRGVRGRGGVSRGRGYGSEEFGGNKRFKGGY